MSDQRQPTRSWNHPLAKGLPLVRRAICSQTMAMIFGSYITCFQCSRDLTNAEVAPLTARRTLKSHQADCHEQLQALRRAPITRKHGPHPAA